MKTKGSDVERRGSDVMQALRAADPAELADLTRTDERAFTALREGITMTPRDTQGKTARRGRRALAAGGLAVALIGGGAAYATFEDWYGGGGGAGGGTGGVSCLSRWVDPLTADEGEFAQAATGGPPITGDPVADCQEYQQMTGRPAIPDAVAFTYNGDAIYVTPKSDVPAAGVALPPTTGGPAFELRHSFSDLVDGGNSRCFTAAEALAFAKAEVARVGLSDWVIERLAKLPGSTSTGTCAWVSLDPDKDRTVTVVATGGRDNSSPSQDVDPSVYVMRDALREGIATKCLTLAQAREVAKRVLGAEHHWPTGSTVDAKAKCASVDMVVGGSTQLFLRGPSTTS